MRKRLSKASRLAQGGTEEDHLCKPFASVHGTGVLLSPSSPHSLPQRAMVLFFSTVLTLISVFSLALCSEQTQETISNPKIGSLHRR